MGVGLFLNQTNAVCHSCTLWLLYGAKKPDFTISLVNVVGLSLQLLYISVYHIYVENKVWTSDTLLKPLVALELYSSIRKQWVYIL